MSSSRKRKGQVSGAPHRAREKREAAEARRRRRRTITAFKVGAIALALLVGGAVALSAYNQRAHRANDLSTIGSGVPAVVQVHDPYCDGCRQLKASVEAILSEFDDEDLVIRFAELDTTEGAAFARRHEAGRVTLLFLDGDGNLRDLQRGVQQPNQLRQTFLRHAAGEL